MTNLAAYTAPPPASYPEFLSINLKEDGKVAITVRAPAGADGSCGACVSMSMDPAEFAKLVVEATLELDKKGLLP